MNKWKSRYDRLSGYVHRLKEENKTLYELVMHWAGYVAECELKREEEPPFSTGHPARDVIISKEDHADLLADKARLDWLESHTLYVLPEDISGIRNWIDAQIASPPTSEIWPASPTTEAHADDSLTE